MALRTEKLIDFCKKSPDILKDYVESRRWLLLSSGYGHTHEVTNLAPIMWQSGMGFPVDTHDLIGFFI